MCVGLIVFQFLFFFFICSPPAQCRGRRRLCSRNSSLAVNTGHEGVSAPSAQPAQHPPTQSPSWRLNKLTGASTHSLTHTHLLPVYTFSVTAPGAVCLPLPCGRKHSSLEPIWHQKCLPYDSQTAGSRYSRQYLQTFLCDIPPTAPSLCFGAQHKRRACERTAVAKNVIKDVWLWIS